MCHRNNERTAIIASLLFHILIVVCRFTAKSLQCFRENKKNIYEKNIPITSFDTARWESQQQETAGVKWLKINREIFSTLFCSLEYTSTTRWTITTMMKWLSACLCGDPFVRVDILSILSILHLITWLLTSCDWNLKQCWTTTKAW